MKTKVLLSGSTSYVGTKFVDLYGSKFSILGLARSDDINPVDLLDFNVVKKLYIDFNPDIVIHLAADVARDTTSSQGIIKSNPAMLENLINLSLPKNIPIIFTSTEAVYGGKEQAGMYKETDPYKPRSPYGESKVISEKLLKGSGLPYLITRGHRHVGVSKRFKRVKWFPDTLEELRSNREVHLDSHKIFNPVLINNVCDIFNHYIENDIKDQVLINIGINKPMTYYDLIVDVAKTLGFNTSLIKDDGNEAGWPQNSSISVQKLNNLRYPSIDYEELLNTIKADL